MARVWRLHSRKGRNGVTELVGVMVVMAILAAMVHPAHQRHLARAKEVRDRQAPIALGHHEEAYGFSNGSYTTLLTSLAAFW